MHSVVLSVPEFVGDQGKLTTSCFITACGVSILFLGLKKATSMIKTWGTDLPISFSFRIPSGQMCCFTVRSLIYSRVIRKINQDRDFFSLRKEGRRARVEQLIYHYTSSFFNRVKKLFIDRVTEYLAPSDQTPPAILRKMIQVLNRSNYDANFKTLQALRNDIGRRHLMSEVHEQNSFLYYIGDFRAERYGHACDHIWILEQFFCETMGDIRFRVYQSWISESTLFQDLERRSYKEGGAGSLSYDQLQRFLDRVEALYCKEAAAQRPTSYKECFGHGSTTKRKPQIYLEENIVNECSLRYLVLPCDPGQALSHLEQSLTRYSHLQKYFYPHSADERS